MALAGGSFLGLLQGRQRQVLRWMGLVLHGVELLSMRYVRLVRHQQAGVWKQAVVGGARRVSGRLEVLWAASLVLDRAHGIPSVSIGRTAKAHDLPAFRQFSQILLFKQALYPYLVYLMIFW